MHSENVNPQGDILVIGDVMLDMYVTGDAWRISPEAPVPVVAVNQKSYTLGGAGNVALNLAKLGCRPHLFGVRGDDQTGTLVSELLDQNGIVDRLHVDNRIPTTTKTRVVANSQQLVRFDEEGRFNGHLNGEYNAIALAVISSVLDLKVKCVILSDYNKGVLSSHLLVKIIGYCRGAGIKVLVDPNRSDWGVYNRATVIKPNLAELREATGNPSLTDKDEIADVATGLIKKHQFEAILVTLGSRGMVLVTRSKVVHIHTTAREVFDVSGAGDTVVATMAACLCAGYSILDAARTANEAAGIVVGKAGTATIDWAELKRATG